MITAKVIRRNAVWDKELLRLLPRLADKEIAVGFPKGKDELAADHPGYGEGVSIIDVAAWNEFGTETQPRRPFLAQSREALEKMFRAGQSGPLKSAIKNGSSANVGSALDRIALSAEAVVRQQITDGEYEENAPLTVKRKEHGKKGIQTRPLIDSGDMRKYVTAVVRKAGS